MKNTGPLWSSSVFGFESNMGVLSRYYCGGAEAIEQITSKYIISVGQCRKNLPESTPKFSFSKNLPNTYDDILRKHGLQSFDGKATQITIYEIQYKSIFSKETKSIDFFLLMKDHTFGVAVYYIIKNPQIFVLLKKYKQVKQHFHLIEVTCTNEFVVFDSSMIKRKMLHLKFGTIDVVSNEPN